MCGEQNARYRDDTKVLAAFGSHVTPQPDRVTVRLPRALAEAAVAAWEREENDRRERRRPSGTRCVTVPPSRR
ncbi:hypothetical protein ACH4GM_07035 [Streptomyces coeruleorubidus]|uniref:hypothetical protein n=1 Tax=Streptomyces coeruleorubidus TaxID=116188 RepID=UPI0037A9A7EE